MRASGLSQYTSEAPIDGVAIMSFDSEADMREAWNTDTYRAAAKIRERIMRETAVGVHVASHIPQPSPNLGDEWLRAVGDLSPHRLSSPKKQRD